MEVIIMSVLLGINFQGSSFQLGARLVKEIRIVKSFKWRKTKRHTLQDTYTSNFLRGNNHHNDQE